METLCFWERETNLILKASSSRRHLLMCELSPKISTVIHDESASSMNVNNPQAQIHGQVKSHNPLLLSSSSSSSSSSSLFSRRSNSGFNDSDAASSPRGGNFSPRDFSEKFRACLLFIRHAHSHAHAHKRFLRNSNLRFPSTLTQSYSSLCRFATLQPATNQHNPQLRNVSSNVH